MSVDATRLHGAMPATAAICTLMLQPSRSGPADSASLLPVVDYANLCRTTLGHCYLTQCSNPALIFLAALPDHSHRLAWLAWEAGNAAAGMTAWSHCIAGRKQLRLQWIGTQAYFQGSNHIVRQLLGRGGHAACSGILHAVRGQHDLGLILLILPAGPKQTGLLEMSAVQSLRTNAWNSTPPRRLSRCRAALGQGMPRCPQRRPAYRARPA